MSQLTSLGLQGSSHDLGVRAGRAKERLEVAAFLHAVAVARLAGGPPCERICAVTRPAISTSANDF